MPHIELIPGGKIIPARDGTAFRDVLFNEGLEFPCGGLGRCRRCKVRVLRGHWPVSMTDWRLLTANEIREGWRLACQGAIQDNLTLEVAQWSAPILVDETTFEFTPADGLGIAIDLGTTTIAAQLLDLRNAQILAIATALNVQGVYGADVMTRLDFALNDDVLKLTHPIRAQIKALVAELLTKADRSATDLRSVVLAGNTAMHHLFCGLPLEQLACEPFEPYTVAPQTFTSGSLGWDFPDFQISFLPPIGGFVGSDILAGILATQLHKKTGTTALMDLGTNGEVVVARDGKLLCASTAAGPAFEGARIRSGMRAATGAIHRVRVHGGSVQCEVLGGGAPRGICGSGLVDAISTGLDTEIINASGRYTSGAAEWRLLEPIALHQKDIRELQLAKGAIAAGLDVLLQELDASVTDLDEVYLAGAFGNYVNRDSACRIGLIPVSPKKVNQCGNTALLGAKLALFPEYRAQIESLRRQVKHVALNERADFQETFLKQIQFPNFSRTPTDFSCSSELAR